MGGFRGLVQNADSTWLVFEQCGLFIWWIVKNEALKRFKCYIMYIYDPTRQFFDKKHTRHQGKINQVYLKPDYLKTNSGSNHSTSLVWLEVHPPNAANKKADPFPTRAQRWSTHQPHRFCRSPSQGRIRTDRRRPSTRPHLWCYADLGIKKSVKRRNHKRVRQLERLIASPNEANRRVNSLIWYRKMTKTLSNQTFTTLSKHP